tara:strand:- start:56 stop:961 length:906 start_codon:yes stop_codon:yes gene_type:complete
MAKQTIAIGTTANDGTGTLLRDAFDMINDNFTELYTDDAGDVNSVNAGTGITVNQTTGAVTVTNSAPDQTVSLTEGANVTITGTYPNFTIASDDVVGAVNSVNGQTGVVVLDSANISEDTNLYYTEARVSANSNVTANTAKVTNATHTGDVTGSVSLTIADDAVTTDKILDANITVGKMAANSVDSDQYVDGSIDTSHIADDQITYSKLAPEFTTTDAITTELDFGGHQVFTKVMTAGTTFTYSNVGIGMVKDFILSGAFTPTFPVGTKTIAGTYSESALNFIQIVAQADGNYWMSISQEQ